MFRDIKVVELASVLAGPLVGSFFSELGAEIIKIENKVTEGDVTRKWKLPQEGSNSISAYYASANFNKKSVFLNLKNDIDYQKAIKEIQNADIVVSNFKSGDAEKLKLDYKTLKSLKEDIIYGEITGYGKGVKRTAFDVVLQAETGYMSMNGTPNSGPVKMPVALIDILAAHQLKEGLLCALIKKLKTNKGSYVSVSLFDSAVSSLANQATNWLMNKHIPKPMGTQHPNIAPYGDMFLSLDHKYIVLAVGSNTQFNVLCQVLNLNTIFLDKRYLDNKVRVQNRDSLNIILQRKIEKIKSLDIEELFTKNKVPFGIVKNMDEVFENSSTKKLILKEEKEGVLTKKVKTVVFEIE